MGMAPIDMMSPKSMVGMARPAVRMPGAHSNTVRLPPQARQEYDKYMQDRLQDRLRMAAVPIATIVSGVRSLLRHLYTISLAFGSVC